MTSTYQPGYLSIEDAARYASVSTKTIKRWIKAGLPVYQATSRGKLLMRSADIDAYLTRKQAPQPNLGAVVEEVLLGLGKEPRAGSFAKGSGARWASL
jgi:excisionase family DNA binding protein